MPVADLAVSAQYSDKYFERSAAVKDVSNTYSIPWTKLQLPIRRCEKGNWIITQGDRVNSLYILREGAILLTRLSADSRDTILAVLGPGDYFGDLPLLNGGISSFNALAIQPTVLMIMRDVIFRRLLDDPSACYFLMTGLAHRCDDAWSQMEALGYSRVQDRVRVLLAWLCEKIGAKTRSGVKINLNQGQLAQMVGSTRETVNRVVQNLKRKGLLSASSGSGSREALLVLAPDQLISSCESDRDEWP